MAAHTVKSSLGNPLTAAQVISTFTSHNRLAVDAQVSTSELINLAADFAGFDASTMKTFSLPTVTTLLDKQDYEVLQPTSDAATIQSWYDAVLPAGKPAAASTTSAAAAPGHDDLRACRSGHHLGGRRPDSSRADSSAATTAAAAAVAPNEPKAWDPVPCS